MNSTPLTRMTVINRAWPLIFANATIPLAGVVDTFVLGLAGDKTDLGGVALGGSIFAVFFWSFYFLRMGTTGLTAQADGAGEIARSQRILARALIIATVLGLAMLLIRDVIAWGGFAILQGEMDVEGKGEAYLLARIWGSPAALAGFALSGWLIGLGRNSATLAIYLAFSLVNIGLDLWFVLGLGMGPGGVGAATAIADWAALVIGLGFVWHAIGKQGGVANKALDRGRLLDPTAMRELFDVNFNLMIRTWCLIVGFTWFANAGARQGTAALAGNHVLLQIVVLWAFVLDAFAFVTETEAGRAFGRKSITELRRAVRLTAEPMIVSGLAFAVLTYLFGAQALSAVVNDAEARDAAIRYLPWCAAIPLLGVGAWLLDGVFIGTTSGKTLRDAGIIAVVIYLVADFLLASPFGNHGVWAAFVIFYVARGGALLAHYPSLERRLQPVPTASDIEPNPSA